MTEVADHFCIAHRGDAQKIEHAISLQQEWKVIPFPSPKSDILHPGTAWAALNGGSPIIVALSRYSVAGGTSSVCTVSGYESVDAIEAYFKSIGAVPSDSLRAEDNVISYELSIDGNWYLLNGGADENSSATSIHLFDVPDIDP